MLVPGVERGRKERALAPLECLFAPALAPHGGSTPSAHHKNQCFEQMPLRRQRFARSDFADVAVIHAFGSFEIQINSLCAEPRPIVKLRRANVFNVKRANGWDAFTFEKELIRRFSPAPFAGA